jgi:hypothetical protein
MTELLKIARACFVGGIVCCGAAMLAAPAFWWLGLFAGFAGGYVAYEFREIVRAAPGAFRMAMHETKMYSTMRMASVYGVVKKFFDQPHPFLYPPLLLATIVYAGLCYWYFDDSWQRFVWSLWRREPATVIVLLFLLAEIYAFVVGGFTTAFILIAFIGARFGDGSYWTPIFSGGRMGGDTDDIMRALSDKGYVHKPATYANVRRWFAMGIGVITRFFVWTVWKHTVIVAWEIIRAVGRFCWYGMKVVHSNERVLSGLDGTIGGAAVYLTLASLSEPLSQQIVVIVCGGVLGAAVGIVHWKVFRRLFGATHAA